MEFGKSVAFIEVEMQIEYRETKWGMHGTVKQHPTAHQSGVQK